MNNSVIHKDMLDSLLNCSSFKNLSNDITIGETSGLLNGFINNKDILQGEQWDVVRNKLANYNSLFVMRSNVADSLLVAIEEAIKKVKDYLGEDLYLDSSKLEELRMLKRRCEENISNLKLLVDSQVLKTVLLANGTETEKLVYVYDEARRNEFKAQINEMENNVLPEVNRLIKKTEGLETVYSDAKALIMSVFENIEQFNEAVIALVPSNKVYFNPNS